MHRWLTKCSTLLIGLILYPVYAANPDQYCRSYANASTAAAKQYSALNCGPSIPRYGTNWNPHYNWCRSASLQQVDTEARIRDKGLVQCKKLKANSDIKSTKFRQVKTPTSKTINKNALQIIPNLVASQAFKRVQLYDASNYGNTKKTFAKPELIKLKWVANDPQVEEVVFQVLLANIDSKDVSLRPPTLLGIGMSKAQSQQGDSRSGEFAFHPWHYTDYRGVIRKGYLGRLALEGPATKFNTTLLGIASQSASPSKPKKLKAQLMAIADQTSVSHARQQRLYVRVIPVLKDQKLDQHASNSFTAIIPPIDSIQYKPYRAVVELDPISEPDKKQEKCVRVTGFVKPDHLGVDVLDDGNRGELLGIKFKTWPKLAYSHDTGALMFSMLFYPTTGTYCPGDWQSSGCSGISCVGETLTDAIKTVAKVWDELTSLIDEIKTTVIALSAQYNPFCLQVGLVADDAAEICEDIIETGTQVAVDAYLVSNGIPPKLPSTTELVNIAKGDIAELSVQLLEQVGVPCDKLVLSETEANLIKKGASLANDDVKSVNTEGGVDLCRDLSRAAVEQVHLSIENQISRDIAAATGVPFFSNVSMIPEPRGQWQPLRARIGLIPTGAPINHSQSCIADISAISPPQKNLFFQKNAQAIYKPVQTEVKKAIKFENLLKVASVMTFKSQPTQAIKPGVTSSVKPIKPVWTSVLLDQPITHA